MRHSAASYFAFLCLLFKVIHAYVSPRIAAEICQNGVDALDRIEMRRKVIVVLNLGGELLALQTQGSFYKFVGQCNPVFLDKLHGAH